MPNTILSIDTSIDCCSIAIYKKNSIYSLSEKCKKTHTTKVLPMLQKILFQTKTKLKDLNYIAFSKGPGNFTGLRISASISESLSLSLNIPIISISTLAIMAEKAWRKCKKSHIIVLITAKTTHVYWGQYIRNIQSIWVRKSTEILLEKKKLNKKINCLQKKWTIVSNEIQNCKYKNFLNVDEIKYFSPNAKDIIPFALLSIKKQKYHFTENKINYLYNF